MFKHLKYIDGTSDKFWEIKMDGTTHTVTYGRNGTSGQSKQKAFDTEEACLKDAEKLIAEKTKKGYSDDGHVDAPVQSSNASTRKSTVQKQHKEEAISAIKKLISEGKVTDIIPFLEKYATGNLEVLKKEIRTAKRYWVDYNDLSNDPVYAYKAQYNWGARGTKEQQRIVTLLALATFSGSDVGTWDIFHELLEQIESPEVQEILAYGKPNWLGTYLLETVKRTEWRCISYLNLRRLESLGYIEFEPELYARAISAYSQDSSNKLFTMLTEDTLTIQRDIPLVLAYETNINNLYTNYNYQSPVNELLWDNIFSVLLADKKIEQDILINGAIEAQTKNWNGNLKSYFRKLIDRMQLSQDTMIAYQQQFFPLLHAEQSAVVNYTVDYLKPLFGHADFQWNEFLDWAEGIFMRADVKTSLKTLLIQFDKLLKHQPQLNDRLVYLVADLFMITDLQIQERTAKFILKQQKEPNEELSMKLQAYKPQMMGTIAADLKMLIQEEGYSEEEILTVLNGNQYESYTFAPSPVTRLNEPFIYPETWNDIFFTIGEVIGGENAIQAEILMNAWIRHFPSFPPDYHQQLAPYIKQLSGSYKESAWYNHFAGVFINMYHKPHVIYTNNDHYSNYSKWVSLMGDQLDLLQQFRITGINLPLLSLPTHKPFWIAPSVLVQRILAYQQADIPIDLLDLSIALSRMVREEMEDIAADILQINDQKVQHILNYALGFDTTIYRQQQSWLMRVFASKDSEAIRWIGIWATVARTHYPDQYFEEFDHPPLKDIPFAARPFRPILSSTATYYNGYDYITKKTEQVYNGEELSYPLPSCQKDIYAFLYHKDIFSRGNNSLLSYYLYKDDVAFMHSLMPQNTESLSIFLTLGFNSKSDSSGKASASYLREMLYDFFRFDTQSSLYLATSLFSKEKEVRAMSVEVLLTTIQENRLDTDILGKHLGMLLSVGYGPIGRFAEVLEQCRDLSSKHNNALLKVLDIAFMNYVIGDKMPTNFKRIVVHYYDLLHKEQYNFPKELNIVFGKLEAYKSLQPILKKLKK